MKLDTTSYYPKSPLDDEDGPATPAETPTAGAIEEAPVPAQQPAPAPAGPEREPELPPSEGEAAVTAICNVLSWVLVPLMMPVYGVMLAFGLSILSFTSFGTRLAFTGIVAGINMLLPMLVIVVLKKMNVVHDLGLNDRKERFIPYVVSIICLIATVMFMRMKGAPEWLTLFFAGGALAGIIEVIINNWWKISVHAAGMAGICALLLHLLFGDYTAPQTETWLLVSIGLTGLLGAARIWLGRHTLGQVLAGYAVGFCAVYFIMMI